MKMKTILPWLAVAFILAGAANPLRAEPTNAPAVSLDREKLHEQLKNMTPEERRAKIEALRKERAAATKPAPGVAAEQRRAQLQKKLEDLRRKKTDGSITPQEQSLLDRMECSAKRAEEQRAKIRTDGKPSTEKASGRNQ
ncbi:MAG: hypothetical protein AAB380_08650 [Verrucomicrobiota bacterium]|mgnify:FL=1